MSSSYPTAMNKTSDDDPKNTVTEPPKSHTEKDQDTQEASANHNKDPDDESKNKDENETNHIEEKDDKDDDSNSTDNDSTDDDSKPSAKKRPRLASISNKSKPKAKTSKKQSGNKKNTQTGPITYKRPTYKLKEKKFDRRGTWEDNFAKLKTFQAMHGHCRVPQRYDVDAKLGEFVKNQRRFRRRGTMKQEKVDLLNAIGFDWEASVEKRETWEEWYEALCQHHQQHGNCNVPSASDLAEWAYKQRCAHQGKTLSKTRQEKLQALEFDWEHQPGDHDRFRSQEAPPPTPRIPKAELPADGDGQGVAASESGESPSGNGSDKPKQPAKSIGKKEPPPMTERNKKRKWEEHLEQLRAFQKEHGHGRIPYPYKANPELGKWAEELRKRERQGKMDLEQFDQLDIEFGFNWTVQPGDNDSDAGAAVDQPRTMTESERFDYYFKRALAFKEKHGHAFVPSKYPPDQAFAYWANRVRWKQRRGLLPQQQEEILNTIGFFNKPPDHCKRKVQLPCPPAKIEQFNAHWEDMYRQICEWQDRNGGKGKFPKRARETFQLARWVETQRWQAKKGKLRQDRVERMVALGMTWEKGDNKSSKKTSQGEDDDGDGNSDDAKVAAKPKTVPRSWQQSFEVLQEYHAKNGHTDVPRFWEEDNRLGQWCHFQRTTKYRRKPEQIAKLESLGFRWELAESSPENRRTQEQEDEWFAIMKQLKQFRSREGHVEVPQVGEHKTLGHWLKKQRRMARMGKLGDDKMKRLGALGVKWETKSDQLFNAGLAKLRAFKKKHGHCHVAHVPPDHRDAALYNFCVGQREFYRQHKMRLDRKKQLEELGFVWEPSHQEQSSSKPSPGSRKRKRGKEVEDEDDDGVRPWNASFDALKAYKDEHGNTNVPLGYLKDRYLGHWVSKQKLRKDELDQDKHRKLNSIQFDWHAKQAIARPSWDESFALLEAYKAKHGDCNVPSRYRPDPQLGEWVCRQRTRQEDLKPDRFDRLAKLGFNFDTVHQKKRRRGGAQEERQSVESEEDST